jgi:hypothetical protein
MFFDNIIVFLNICVKILNDTYFETKGVYYNREGVNFLLKYVESTLNPIKIEMF